MTYEGECQFCLEFKGLSGALYAQFAEADPPDRTIYRAKNFRIIPPLGEFVEGAVMIVSERHVASCSLFSQDEYEELESLLETTEAVLTREFMRPIFFEHGPSVCAGKGVCCVDHAHVHAFPVEVDVHGFLAPRLPATEIRAMSELERCQSGPRGYLFLQQQGRRFHYPCDVIPSQLIRQVIASALGVPERWNWRDYLGLAEMRRTWERLRHANWRLA